MNFKKGGNPVCSVCGERRGLSLNGFIGRGFSVLLNIELQSEFKIAKESGGYDLHRMRETVFLKEACAQIPPG